MSRLGISDWRVRLSLPARAHRSRIIGLHRDFVLIQGHASLALSLSILLGRVVTEYPPPHSSPSTCVYKHLALQMKSQLSIVQVYWFYELWIMNMWIFILWIMMPRPVGYIYNYLQHSTVYRHKYNDLCWIWKYIWVQIEFIIHLQGWQSVILWKQNKYFELKLKVSFNIKLSEVTTQNWKILPQQ